MTPIAQPRRPLKLRRRGASSFRELKCVRADRFSSSEAVLLAEKCIGQRDGLFFQIWTYQAFGLKAAA